MYPGNELNLELIINLVNKAYWPIYGEMQILEEINDRDRCLKENEDKCPTESGTYYSYIALIAYMVIANVLLINLLIAMFSSTFQDVQVIFLREFWTKGSFSFGNFSMLFFFLFCLKDNTDRIWKFQRYRLVFEYYDASAFPPPISFIGYFISIVKFIRGSGSREDVSKMQPSMDAKKSLKGLEEEERLDRDENELFLERKFAEELIRNQKILERESMDSRLRYNNEKLEYLEHRLNEMAESRMIDYNEMATAVNWLMSQQQKSSTEPSELNTPFMNKKSTKKSKA